MLGRTAPTPQATWRYGSHAENVADVYLPTSRSSGTAVVLVHGGFWRPEYDRAHLRPLASGLAGAGNVVVSLEYRRIPGRPDASLDDLALALDHLPELLGAHDCSAYVLAGHSAGGHLALLLHARSSGNQRMNRGTIALAPVADLQLAEDLGLDGDAVTAFLGTHASGRPDLDPALPQSRTDPARAPVVVIHGVRDSLVPVDVSRRYAATGSCELLEVQDCAHFELIDPENARFAVVADALARLSADRPR